MGNLNSELMNAWREASRDLGIKVEMPYALQLKSGAKIEADVLVKDFGHVNGMLVSSCDIFSALTDEIVSAGYGYSVFSTAVYQTYDRDLFIEALNDWGWSRLADQRPSWYIDVSA